MITLGPYTAGEIPPPLVITFKKSDGTPIDFNTGGPWQGRFTYRSYGGSLVTRTTAVPNQNNGNVTYTWVAADFAASGDFEGEMWVGNGSNRYDSEPVIWQTRSAVAVPAPSI